MAKNSGNPLTQMGYGLGIEAMLLCNFFLFSFFQPFSKVESTVFVNRLDNKYTCWWTVLLLSTIHM